MSKAETMSKKRTSTTFTLEKTITMQNCSSIEQFVLLDEKNFPNIYFVHAKYSSSTNRFFLYDNFINKEVHTFSTENVTKFHMNPKSITILNTNDDHIILYYNKMILEIKKKLESNKYIILFDKISIEYRNGRIYTKKLGQALKFDLDYAQSGSIPYHIKKSENDHSIYFVYPHSAQNNNQNNKYKHTKSYVIDVKNMNVQKEFAGYVYQDNIVINDNKHVILEGMHEYIIYDYVTDNEVERIPKEIKPVDAQSFTNLTEVIIVGKTHISVKYTDPNNPASTKMVLYKFMDDDEIPDSEKCVVCFAKTEKKKVLVPCGHTQFCEKCINDIQECPLCRKKVDLVMKIHK